MTKPIDGIYQECDGFHYYHAPEGGGCFSAHTLRDIAIKLDEINRPWAERIERELGLSPQESLIEAMIEALEKLGGDRTARIDARVWHKYFARKWAKIKRKKKS